MELNDDILFIYLVFKKLCLRYVFNNGKFKSKVDLWMCRMCYSRYNGGISQQQQQQQQNDYTEDLNIFAHSCCILSVQEMDQFSFSVVFSRDKVSNAG